MDLFARSKQHAHCVAQSREPARRILRAPYIIAHAKIRCVFGHVFMSTAGMLAVPIRLQHWVIKINII